MSRRDELAATRDQLSELWHQDVEIDVRVRSLVRALDRDDLKGARASIGALESYVAQHLQREEDVYLPAALQVGPELRYALETIRLAHGGIRSDLRMLRESIGAGHLDAARTQVEVFLENFRSHEQAEERVVEQLEALRPR
jgi:hypothetical protein